MKYFFRRKIPLAADVLVIESGSRDVAQKAMGNLRRHFPGARYHLCTCRPEPPAAGFTDVFRASDYSGTRKKLGLLWSFRRKKWGILAILCTGEPLLWRWKIMALCILPAKVLIINENADFFWLDWDRRANLRRLWGVRWGISQGEFAATFLRALVFPITLLILLVTAAVLYGRRWRHLLFWKIRDLFSGKPSQQNKRGVPPRQDNSGPLDGRGGDRDHPETPQRTEPVARTQ